MYFFCRIREAAHFPDTFTQIPRQNCYIYLFVERTWWKMSVKCPIEATQPHTHIGPHSPPPSSRTVWVTPGTAVPIRFILFSCLRVWIMDQTRGQVISRYQQWYLQTENYFSCFLRFKSNQPVTWDSPSVHLFTATFSYKPVYKNVNQNKA